ncbi:hypothetical protein Psed_3059 [Pseudonocardia dioxanivorans CB1190]|uniref:Alpha/beta hydrolase n=1 Tax=Pseudonocardia dioxanivorans (strain ATCC 55486 / DSM 44775 / JCM 13855 / CB1190) TaxID=675635 RepID=F4CSV9_PSEUX|nr:hypothetical protein Psed_3059 [Pseudonocardia dioxanivorans CB1190]
MSPCVSCGPPAATVAVVLPGSGSDAEFVRSSFAEPLGALGIRLVAPRPRASGAVVAGYLSALDDALRAATAARTALLVGGVSLGAHVAIRWAAALDDPRPLAGVLLALPAWTGSADAAPAAVTAAATAARVRAAGRAAAVADARAGGAPPWLTAELERAWAGYGAGLAGALDEAARTPGPAPSELTRILVPAGIAALLDDPLHPVEVARRWAELLPRAGVVTARLAAVGADPATLGRAAVLGWLHAGGRV